MNARKTRSQGEEEREKVTRLRNPRGATSRARIPNRIEIAQRAQRAIALASQGMTWEEVAREAGYKGGKGTAWRAVHRELRRNLARDVETFRTLECLRLDELHKAYWQAALDGDGRAFDIVIKIHDRRARLLGLNLADAPRGSQEPTGEFIIKPIDTPSERQERAPDGPDGATHPITQA